MYGAISPSSNYTAATVDSGNGPKQMPALKRLKARSKFGGGSVMLWGCFSTAGVGNLTKIDGTMNASYFVDILADNLPESIQDLHGQNHVVFQQDNDPKHSAKITKALLAEQKNIEVMEWPAQSPDLTQSSICGMSVGASCAQKFPLSDHRGPLGGDSS